LAEKEKTHKMFNVNKSPTDATVCRYLFTAKLLYMFRMSQHPQNVVVPNDDDDDDHPRRTNISVFI